MVVVVSAQGDTTDDLIAKGGGDQPRPLCTREMDMLLAAGEQISIALLAMALNELGCHATSLTGWQAGFRTDRAYTKARITKLETGAHLLRAGAQPRGGRGRLPGPEQAG